MQKTKFLSYFAIAAMAFSITSCTLHSRKGTTQASQVVLQEGSYELSDIKTATGESKIFLGFSLGDNDKAAEVTTYSTYGTGGLAVPTGCCLAGAVDPAGTAKSIALYNLLEANPGYDAVMAPNYKVEADLPCGLPSLYAKYTVTVTARMIRYKQ